MATRETTELAKNEMVQALVNAILMESESYDPDIDLIEEMEKQATRIAKFLGFVSYPGLPNL
jgi:hypothetical protein